MHVRLAAFNANYHESESCICHHVPVYLYGAVRMNSLFFQYLIVFWLFVCFIKIETVPLKSMSFEFIGNCLNREH